MTWKKRIEEAKKRGRFTGDADSVSSYLKECDLGCVTYRETCLVGEFLKVKTEEEADLKYTEELEKLGMQFFNAVHAHNIPRAIKIHNQLYPQNPILED